MKRNLAVKELKNKIMMKRYSCIILYVLLTIYILALIELKAGSTVRSDSTRALQNYNRKSANLTANEKSSVSRTRNELKNFSERMESTSYAAIKPEEKWSYIFRAEGMNTIWTGIVTPVIVDLEGDGVFEAVFTVQAEPSWLSILYPSSGRLEMKRIDFPLDCPYANPRSFPSVADIDDDGIKEILVSCMGTEDKILIYDKFVLRTSWILDLVVADGGIYNALVIEDLNKDGHFEIIYSGWNINGSWLVVLDRFGNTLSGFPIQLENKQASEPIMPAVGNFDSDSDLEIVVISHENLQPQGEEVSTIRVVDFDGSVQWVQEVDALVYNPPAVGDLNNDGYFDEIAFTSDEGIYILTYFGNFLLYRPIDVKKASSPIALGNLDDDDELELVFGFDTYYLGINIDGTQFFIGEIPWPAHFPPIIADINGDDELDILSSSHTSIFAWDLQGATIEGFPRNTMENLYGNSSVMNIKGKFGLVSSADWTLPESYGLIYFWELSNTEHLIEWPMFQFNERHTGRYSVAQLQHENKRSQAQHQTFFK